MDDTLRFYVGFNGGLTVYSSRNGALTPGGEFFQGRTLEQTTV